MFCFFSLSVLIPLFLIVPFPSIPFVHPLLLFTIIIHFLSHFSPDDLIRPFYPTKEIPSDLSNFPPADK